ncbi:MAG: hypothetical protein J1E59_05020, partial [Treponema sp.]|nr:hypothetical protein [Treponema sp.]
MLRCKIAFSIFLEIEFSKNIENKGTSKFFKENLKWQTTISTQFPGARRVFSWGTAARWRKRN